MDQKVIMLYQKTLNWAQKNYSEKKQLVKTQLQKTLAKIKTIDIKKSSYIDWIKKIQHSNAMKTIKSNRKVVISGGLILLLVFSLVGFNKMNTAINKALEAYEVNFNGEVIAIVRDIEDFKEALNEAYNTLEVLAYNDVNLLDKVTYNKIIADDDMLTNFESIIRNISMRLDMEVRSVAIFVDGKELLQVEDMETAREVLAAVMEPFKNNEEVQFISIDFKEDIKLVEVISEAGLVRSKEYAISYILLGTDEEKVHVVEKGESTWTIAKKYNLRVDDIALANPNINPNRLQIGQEISLIVPKPHITVRTKELAELVETIPFNTVYEDNNSLYKGDRKIVVQGAEGKREVKAYIIRENGNEVEREIINSNLISEPKTRVIAQGTKTRPKTMATGLFVNPTRGRLTSTFGVRWGRRHEGIDIAAPTGTSIVAADGGKVVFAGRSGSFGNLIIIDHENGFQTYYAHCSKLLVSKGDRVHRGQEIARVGNTGNSTGPHLHFEVRKNGRPVNPLSFVRY